MSSLKSELRKRKFEESQKLLAPEKQLSNRTDLDDDAQQKRARSTLQKYALAIASFTEFTENVLNLNSNDPGHGSNVAAPDAPLPTRATIRKWLVYYATTADGQIFRVGDNINQSVSLNTVRSYAMNFFSGLKRNDPGKDNEEMKRLNKDTVDWVDTEIEREVAVTRQKKRKPVAYIEDTDVIIRTLFSEDLDWTSQKRLAICLAINMFLDCSIRTGEITDSTDASRALTWNNVDFYKVQRNDGGTGSLLYAILMWQHGKGRDGNHQKDHGTTLHNLEPHMILHDTATQLLLTALHADVLEDFRPDMLDALLDAPSSPSGSRITIKQNARSDAVFGGTSVLKANTLSYAIGKLGLLAGFNEKLTMGALRRGAYFALQKRFSEKTVNKHMKWNPNSRIYEWYESDISNVDVQSAMRNTPADDAIALLSSIRLGRISTGLPEVLDEARRKKVRATPQIVALTTARTQATNAILQKFNSRSDAAAADDPTFTAYRLADAELTRALGRADRVELIAWRMEIEHGQRLQPRQALTSDAQNEIIVDPDLLTPEDNGMTNGPNLRAITPNPKSRGRDGTAQPIVDACNRLNDPRCPMREAMHIIIYLHDLKHDQPARSPQPAMPGKPILAMARPVNPEPLDPEPAAQPLPTPQPATQSLGPMSKTVFLPYTRRRGKQTKYFEQPEVSAGPEIDHELLRDGDTRKIAGLKLLDLALSHDNLAIVGSVKTTLARLGKTESFPSKQLCDRIRGALLTVANKSKRDFADIQKEFNAQRKANGVALPTSIINSLEDNEAWERFDTNRGANAGRL
ncbi:hypothetical protein LTR15_005781 [Elasticomyces elasticus]|nr:hypothetical protein LTR15_005781 [Elasticomyces elasticus]